MSSVSAAVIGVRLPTGRGPENEGDFASALLALGQFAIPLSGEVPAIDGDRRTRHEARAIGRFAAYASRERAWPAKRNPVTPV
jgi:hypothetical protein